MTGFNIRGESYIHEYILFRFPGSSDNAIAINYCISYAKHYIYLEKVIEENTKREFNVLSGVSVPFQIYTQDRKKYLK